MRSYGRGPDLIGLVSLQEELSPSAGTPGERPCEATERRLPPPSRGEDPHQKPTLAALALRPPACSIRERQPEPTEAARACPAAGAEWGCCRFLPCSRCTGLRSQVHCFHLQKKHTKHNTGAAHSLVVYTWLFYLCKE